MTPINNIFIITILSVFLAILFVGCESRPSSRPYTRNTPSGNSNSKVEKPKPWKPYSDITNESFVVTNLSIEKKGLRDLILSGVVSECSYDLVTGECYWQPQYKLVPVRESYRSSFDRNKTKYHERNKVVSDGIEKVTRNDTTVKKHLGPSNVVIENPFGPNAVAKVGADGSFSADLTLDEDYYLDTPSKRNCPKAKSRYFKLLHYKQPKKIEILPESPPKKARFKSCQIDLPVHWFKADMDLIGDYVQDIRTYQRLEVFDSVSRVPITASIVVTGLNVPSLEEVKKSFADEFGDEETAAEAMKLLSKNYLKQGEQEKRHAQSLSFQALVGGSYKIETTHGKYYYFSGVLDVTKTGKAKKILLIEKGGKVRQENVKEGEGGIMID